jgi:tetratricopeptide (TPR) repeat protein
MMLKDQAVENIIATNKWQRPLYLAVTVPDVMGLDKQLVMEGLVFRINPTPVTERIDLTKTLENLNKVYKYEGLLAQDPTNYVNEFGVYDSTVFKDENSTRLVQNYAAAFSRVALALFEEGRTEEALKEMDKAEAISPYFPGVAMAKGVLLEELGRPEDAIAHYEKMLQRYHGDWQIALRLGQVLLNAKRAEESIAYFEMARRNAPDEYYPYQGLASAYYQLNRYEDALGVLEQLAVQHPEDKNIRAYISELRQSMQSGELPSAGGDSAASPGGGAAASPNGN